MSSNVNLISTGSGSLSVKSSVKTAVNTRTSTQQGDFSQSLDQAQQARSKDTRTDSYAGRSDAYSNADKAQDKAVDSAQDEAAEAAKDQVQEAGRDQQGQPADKADKANKADKPEAGENAPETDGGADINVQAMDQAAAQVLAAGAEASLSMNQNVPLAELNTYFQAGYDYANAASVMQQVNTESSAATAMQSMPQTADEQPLDSLQAVNVMEELQPVDGETQSAEARTQNVKAQQTYAPSSIEALLGNRQTATQSSTLENGQGAGNIFSSQQDSGRQMLNMLAGQQVYAQPAKSVDIAQTEETVMASQLTNLVGDVEVVQAPDGAQAEGRLADMNSGSQNQQGLLNSQGQQQGMQMSGEAAFDVVLPGDNQSQDKAGTQSSNVNAMGFQQTLDNVQGNNVQSTSAQQPQQTAETYNVPQQIVEQAKLLQRGTDTEMVIKLNPEHLGQLSLKVSVNGNGGVTATFHTDNAQVRAILENTMVQLKQQLDEQGIKVDQVEVQTGLPDGQLPQDQGQQGFYQQGQDRQVRSQAVDLRDFEESSEALSVDAAGAESEPQVVLDSQGNQISTGINYRV